MSRPSFRDYELLSAYLDRELGQKDKTRLVARIVKEPELAKALEELRQTRSLLRQTPHRKAPRNFTLTPKMAGIRPPVPRVVPALSWASAIAMVMFVCTLGYNLLASGGLSFGAAAPKASDLYVSNQSAGTAAATSAPVAPLLAPTATQPPAALLPPGPGETASTETPAPTPTGLGVTKLPPGAFPRPSSTPTVRGNIPQNALITPTASPSPTETAILAYGSGTSIASPTPEITATSTFEPTARALSGTNPSVPPPTPPRALPWAYIWLGLAAVCIGAAFLVRWLSRLAFVRKGK